MGELNIIETTLKGAARRRRWQRGWRGFWTGLLAGSAVGVSVLALYKLLPLPVAALLAAAAALPVACAVGFGVGWWRKDTLLATARWLDEREHLEERVSTAVELAGEAHVGQWRELLVSDAARKIAGLNVRRLVPIHLPTAARWALLVLAVGASLGFVPEHRSQGYLQNQREKESVREAGRNLADVSRRVLEKHPPALEGTKAAVKSVGDLGTQLNRAPVTRSEALRELAKMTENVQEKARDLAKSPALKAIEKALNNSSRNTPASAEELQKQIDSLQKALGNKNAPADALEKLQQELQKAQQAAANMAANGSRASDAAKDSLAKSLANLARQAQEMGAALPSLEEAIAALDAGKIDQVLKDLQVAEKDLDKLKDLAQQLQQAQQQASQLGKDLAEQLKNGQAAAAVETLQKMVNLLKGAQLSAEQSKAIMDEVSKAIPHAAEYGKVQEFLKQATQRMQEGARPAAAQSLADAAKELQNLMEQLADAQDLKGTLEALKRAQMCVGTGQSWGQCVGQGGFKPGGKPGRGVGTWADEGVNLDVPPNTGAWDNSGVQRPDMDSRGLSDRDANLPDNLTPTKVKGRFNPGGPMPSITLKGVSIKGQSTVAVQEAVTAAQSEAQGALSQDQVPRAYQGAVKDYFDDLKK